MRQKIITATAIVLAIAGIISLIILFSAGKGNSDGDNTAYTKIDEFKWTLDGTTGLYALTDIEFVEKQEKLDYKSISIYSPEEYIVPDTSLINKDGKVGDYAALNSPIVISADLTADEIKDFVGNGIVCVILNASGGEITINSPKTVTAFKAAVKYIRKNNELVPGSADLIFAAGDYEYAGVCATLAASGDSAAYYSYLDYCGAMASGMLGTYLSDSIAGAICTNGIYLNEMEKSELEWVLGIDNSYTDYIKSVFNQNELDVDIASAYNSEIMNLIGKAVYSFVYERAYPAEKDGDEYDSADKLIEHLNSYIKWISPEQTMLQYKTVSITSVADFMTYREATLGAVDKTAYENVDFGKMTQAEKHKFEICNPLYYLSDYYQGKGTSEPAKAWYISSGILSDVSFVQNYNLSKAVSESVGNAQISITAEWSEEASRNPETISQWIHGIVFPESENAVG